jgi:hypothetical protein
VVSVQDQSFDDENRRGFESYCLLARWPGVRVEVVLARRGVPGGCLRLLRSDRPNTAAHGTAPHAYMGHHTCKNVKMVS